MISVNRPVMNGYTATTTATTVLLFTLFHRRLQINIVNAGLAAESYDPWLSLYLRYAAPSYCDGY